MVNLKNSFITYNKMLRFMIQHGLSDYSQIDIYIERVKKIKPQCRLDEILIHQMFKCVLNCIKLRNERIEETHQVDESDEELMNEYKFKSYPYLISYIDEEHVNHD